MKSILFLGLLALGGSASPDFANYWYTGKAEVSVYDLVQERYGEPREGTVSLIYVTEPFSKEKQVKLDRPTHAGEDKISVLKLNTVKKYVTGIYPYSVMSSAFGAVDTSILLKATTSLQEWCGQTFMQANRGAEGHYKIQGFSYFESEGDTVQHLKETRLEEELWL